MSLNRKQRRVVTHESKIKNNEINRDAYKMPAMIILKSKFLKFTNSIKEFIVKETDFMVLLTMVICISLLFDPYGVTKTIPLVLIMPFILGTFYAGRKKIMFYTVIALLALTNVNQNASISATVIVITVFLTFTGIYSARYLDHFKRYGLIKKILKGLITLVLVLFSVTCYLFEFGSPLTLYKAKDKVEDFIKSNNYASRYEIWYEGTTFNQDKKIYDVNYRSRSGEKITFEYNQVLDKVSDGINIYLKDKYEKQIEDAYKTFVMIDNQDKAKYIEGFDVTFINGITSNENIKLADDFNFNEAIDIDIYIEAIDSYQDEEGNIIRDNDELKLYESEVSKLGKCLNTVNILRNNKETFMRERITLKYENGNLVSRDYSEVELSR